MNTLLFYNIYWKMLKKIYIYINLENQIKADVPHRLHLLAQ